MKEVLEKLFEGQFLSVDAARKALTCIASGEVAAAQVAAFLTVFRVRGLAVEELEGFRAAMLELCVPVELDRSEVVDVVGTGGDGKDTFNISTAAAFVAAGAGVKIAKHGNYGASSKCGSSNVLEALGVPLRRRGAELQRDIAEKGICFIHAAFFHPAMKHVAPIRRELGFRTFFNILGPLVNPARPERHVLGVSSVAVADLYRQLLARTEHDYRIVYSIDGYDELSLTGSMKIIGPENEQVVAADYFKMQPVSPSELKGGSGPEEGAAILRRILQDKGTEAQARVVVANAAMALALAHPAWQVEDCVAAARESIASGRAYQVLQAFTGEAARGGNGYSR